MRTGVLLCNMRQIPATMSENAQESTRLSQPTINKKPEVRRKWRATVASELCTVNGIGSVP
jgi:hypothetical protein